VLLAEDVLGRLNEYVRLAGRVSNGPAGGAALKGFSRQPCFSWFSSSLAYAFLFFFHTGLLVCTANMNHDCLQSTSLTKMCMICFNACSGKHSAPGIWLLLARTTAGTAKLRRMVGITGSALFSKCQIEMHHQDIQIAALLCLHVQVHENVVVMPCMDVE